MTTQTQKLTQGVHHVGLTVKDLGVTKEFFMDVLGYDQLGEVADYPAVFLSDGNIMMTLWQAKNDQEVAAFDRQHNIGLHHISFKIDPELGLEYVHQKLKEAQGVTIEFAPENLGNGPTQHMMITEPGGIRIEFIAPAKR